MSSILAKCLINRLMVPVLSLILCAVNLRGETNQVESTIYDPNPKHLWNRLNETLFMRTAEDGKRYGLDDLDILYWATTKHLLVAPSHQQALAILDEFINRHGEKLIRDPLKRVLLQRDLWELFDWSAESFAYAKDVTAHRELQSRLAVAIRRVALSTNEIASLPDNYTQAEANPALTDLPHDLFQTNGDWVIVHDSNDSLTAPTHVAQFDGHSVFSVALRVPTGRQAAITYLDKLRSFAQFEHVWLYQTNRSSWGSTNSSREILELNPAIPQFPTNTEWALVRRMCVIDTEGRIQPTRITESIQIRRYLETERGIPDPRFSTRVVQQFLEFELDKRRDGALRTIGQNEKAFSFVHFMSKGIDLFEPSFRNTSNDQQPRDSAALQDVHLKTCYTCHFAGGIFSVNSYTRFLSFSTSPERPANLTPFDFGQETMGTIAWKQRQFDWGLLLGLWSQYPQAGSN